MAYQEPVYIYRLADPFTLKVMYIGVSKDLYKRYSCHLSNSHERRFYSFTSLNKWIFSIVSKGDKPVMSIIEHCCDMTVDSLEQYWISYYRALNPCLLNISIGGKKHNLKRQKIK